MLEHFSLKVGSLPHPTLYVDFLIKEQKEHEATNNSRALL